MRLFDTIAAIATPAGNGGIAVIRISGEAAVDYAKRIVFPVSNVPFENIKSHQMVLSKIKTAKGRLIDEALAVIMRAPKSYTGEDVVEIQCHGGTMAARLIMDELSDMGVRSAERGEFTRRAFINGKADLSSAEAVMDVIEAKSRLGLFGAASNLSGKLGEKISALRGEVLSLAARLSAAADFPDEIEEIEDAEFSERVEKIKNEAQKLIKSFERGRFIRDGVGAAIVGKPNVGKSSLLNAILGEERAIVTDIPGTTRDTVEEYAMMGALSLRIKDTAGIRESSDAVEKIGIERAKKSIDEADLVIFVLDASRKISSEDAEIAGLIGEKPRIVVLNKQDKAARVTKEDIKGLLNVQSEDIVLLALPEKGEKTGLLSLEERICEKFIEKNISDDEVQISSRRHRDCLVRANEALGHLTEGLSGGVPKDLLYIDLEDAAASLGEITGETVQEEIVDMVFEKFCVGK